MRFRDKDIISRQIFFIFETIREILAPALCLTLSVGRQHATRDIDKACEVSLCTSPYCVVPGFGMFEL